MDKSPVTGVISKISRYSLHDGPGIRSTVFMKGCGMRCAWCANPESLCAFPQIGYRAELCNGCGKCAGICQQKAIAFSGGLRLTDETLCGHCGCCVGVCETDALQLFGRTVTPLSLYRELRTDAPFWRRSGGGITLSGGEPLFQADFTFEFLSLCKARGVHTAIETSLLCPPKKFMPIIDLVSFVQCDIKAIDAALHKELTGVDNRVILRNADALLRSGHDVLVRVPVVPGLTDSDENLSAIGAFVSLRRPGAHIEILPYHDMGVTKYWQLGMVYPPGDLKPPGEARMERCSRILSDFTLRVIDKGGWQCKR